MNVLISAVACNPYLGSENYFGWAAVKGLARDHELWVVTGSRNKPDLERAAAEGLVPPQVHFVYAGTHKPWHRHRLLARLQNWREFMVFAGDSLRVSRQLQRNKDFDLVHHVTFATWRVASPLWQLGLPFVFGPIGGYEQFPARFFPMLSPSAAAFELARMGSNVVSRCSPAVRRSLQMAAHVFAANEETERLAKTVRGASGGVSQLLPGFYSKASIASFARFVPDKRVDGPLRLFAGGNMEGRKGVALAIRALARAKAAGVRFLYRLGAGGPEIGHLRNLAARLGLTAEIQFEEALSGEAYQRELGASHVFMLPSFRESAGLTMMEAMLAGCVPVVVDRGGPRLIVADDCGYKLPVTNRRRLVEQLADTILAIDRNRSLIREKGQIGSRRIANHFSEDNYLATVNAVYQSLVGTNCT